MRKSPTISNFSEAQLKLEELLPGFSWEKEGWEGLVSRVGELKKELVRLKEQLMISRSELHHQASLNSSLTYRLYELEQAVGVLEKRVSGEKALAGGAALRVQYLERLFQEISRRLPEKDRKEIEEALRREIYFPGKKQEE
ncbi:MAG: hypothetical protein NUV68_00540 [Caldiserica bacterium]|jgi:hypothetical protein|nr:hypothetical protein [Caldisericota bacterium]MDH7561846.1 hypothetical protein [Caldisericota bacterium]